MPWTPPDPDSPLRIAYLTYRGKPHVGGQGVYSRHLTKALVDLGHHVEVYGGPPYPIIDDRIPFHPLPSLDIWADPHPMRKPRLWEWNDWTDALEHASFATGTFSEPMAFSWRVWRELRNRRNDFDLIQDNQTLGWGILKLHQEGWPILETIHHPITVDRKLELEHARTPWEKFGKRRWYAFTKMQTQVAQRMPRILSSAYDNALAVGRTVAPGELLYWGTRGGALALGMDHVGALEAGLDADMVLVDVPEWVEDADGVLAWTLFYADAPLPRRTWVRGRQVWDRDAWTAGGGVFPWDRPR